MLFGIALLAILAAVAAATVYIVSARALGARYRAPELSLDVLTDAASVERGHIVTALRTCRVCHGDDSGGKVYADMGPVGIIAGPNLTTGRGDIRSEFTTADWVCGIRYGVHREGATLIAIPSEVFTNMTDEDLAATISYLRPARLRRPVWTATNWCSA